MNSVAFIIDCVLSWQSKGLSNESIKPPATSNNSLNPKLNYCSTKTRVQFIGSCLKQSSPIFTHKKVVNIYVVYELAASSSHINDSTIKNCLFGADMSSSININNKKKYILVLGRGPTQELEITLTAEKMFSIKFTVARKKFCLSLHYNGANSYLFVNGTEIYKFKAKDAKIVPSPLC